MSRARRDDGLERLLDAWTPPEDAGEAVGCVATTFTFDADFFERDCLARFLSFERDPDEDGPLYLIERDERLASLSCAAAIADTRHCGQRGSLRWDLIAARPRSGIQHAKIAVLQWRRHLRILVASANLTREGYRTNREGLARLDFGPDALGPRSVGRAIVGFLRELLAECCADGPAGDRVRRLLEGASIALTRWSTDDAPPGLAVHGVLISPRRRDLIEQVSAALPEGRPARSLEVVSPFYDDDQRNVPAESAWSLLAKRGDVSVAYTAIGRADPASRRIIVEAPESLRRRPPGRNDSASVEIRVVDATRPDPGEKDTGSRPLHLKSMRLTSDTWTAWMVGSSNWTRRGTGLGGRPNWEANLLFIANDAAADVRRRIASSDVPTIVCDQNRIDWRPVAGDDDGAGDVPLPFGFQDAVLIGKPGSWSLRLSFRVDEMPERWTVRDPTSSTVVADTAAWRTAGRPNEWVVPWPTASLPSGVWVEWSDAATTAWWPITVDGSSTLPTIDELRDLPLEALLQALVSSRPLHQALARWLRRRGLVAPAQSAPATYDPHDAVDTSGFLLQRMRLVSIALTHLRRRLERPAATREAVEWRINGPLGPEVLLAALRKEARSSAESAFFATELVLELRRVRPVAADDCVRPEEVRQRVVEVADRLAGQLRVEEMSALPGLARYARAGLKEMSG